MEVKVMALAFAHRHQRKRQSDQNNDKIAQRESDLLMHVNPEIIDRLDRPAAGKSFDITMQLAQVHR